MTTQKNGTIIPTNGKANGTQVPSEQKPKLSATLAVVKPEPKAQQKNDSDPLSLEDRLFKLNRLFELQSKYNRLEQSLTTLKDFDLKKDGENITLELYDETSRKRFQTKNVEVVPEIVSALREIIVRRKKALEPLLSW